jgi:hypothetical protein
LARVIVRSVEPPTLMVAGLNPFVPVILSPLKVMLALVKLLNDVCAADAAFAGIELLYVPGVAEVTGTVRVQVAPGAIDPPENVINWPDVPIVPPQLDVAVPLAVTPVGIECVMLRLV